MLSLKKLYNLTKLSKEKAIKTITINPPKKKRKLYIIDIKKPIFKLASGWTACDQLRQRYQKTKKKRKVEGKRNFIPMLSNASSIS